MKVHNSLGRYDWFKARSWRLAHGVSLELGPEGLVMGILNVTPDSFSDGGRFDDPARAIDQAMRMIDEGAHIVDVGGESTRPGGQAVSAAQEQERALPIVEAIAGASQAAISIDTYRADTARAAIAAGAHIVNDVWGLQKDPQIATAAAETGAGVCIMHTGRERERDRDVIADQFAYLRRSLDTARKAGIADDALVLDPGFGFAKDPDENLELLANLARLHQLGLPLMAGTSRKRFVGHVSGRDGDARDVATAATTAIARLAGAAIVRVHDVAANVDAMKMADAVLAAKRYD